MARWRPRLVVRRTRGGGIASPSTTGGFLFFAAIGFLLFSTMLFVAVHHGEWWVLLAAVVSVWPIQDAWAWLAATDDERAVFLAEVERLQGAGAGPAASAKGRAELSLLALLGIAVCLAGATLHPGFYVPGLGLFALAVFGAWEQARRARAA